MSEDKNQDMSEQIEANGQAHESVDDSLEESCDIVPEVAIEGNAQDLSKAYNHVISEVSSVDSANSEDNFESQEQESSEIVSDSNNDCPESEPDIDSELTSGLVQEESEETAATELEGPEVAGEDIDSQDIEDAQEDDSDDEYLEESLEITTSSVVEAILFAADEPVGLRKLVEIIDAGGVKEVKKHIRSLNKKYSKMGCAFRIEELAGGYQMLTLSAYNPWLSKLIKVRSETKLTAAAMETLAIIAYKQPIMRVEIENIRGVAAGEMIRQLIEKGLVKITGRAEELGRPLLYGTTQKFLDIFGLATLKDLPQPESAKKQ